MSSSDEPSAASSPDAPRQWVVRVRGRRRAQLTPAPGTDPDPEAGGSVDGPAPAAGGEGGPSGPNDERMRRDVPPHY